MDRRCLGWPRLPKKIHSEKLLAMMAPTYTLGGLGRPSTAANNPLGVAAHIAGARDPGSAGRQCWEAPCSACRGHPSVPPTTPHRTVVCSVQATWVTHCMAGTPQPWLRTTHLCTMTCCASRKMTLITNITIGTLPPPPAQLIPFNSQCTLIPWGDRIDQWVHWSNIAVERCLIAILVVPRPSPIGRPHMPPNPTQHPVGRLGGSQAH